MEVRRITELEKGTRDANRSRNIGKEGNLTREGVGKEEKVNVINVRVYRVEQATS